MRQLILDPNALDDLHWWLKTDQRMLQKILQLLEETPQHPFQGRGKPEALKFDLAGCWSRRISLEHRLVYEVTEDHVRILTCRFHYR